MLCIGLEIRPDFLGADDLPTHGLDLVSVCIREERFFFPLIL